MEMNNCPKCNSKNVILRSCICETIKYGFGIRVHCQDCSFETPKSKWQWISSDNAIKIWNKYKRKLK